MDNDESKREWEWRYSFWTGIMYGPIPVGIIAVGLLTLFYLAYQLIG